jgi:tetratricopeptide (TPR) repeat protein
MNHYLTRILFAFLFIVYVCAYSQTNSDSLLKIINTSKADTARIEALCSLAKTYMNSEPDTAIYIYRIALDLSEKISWDKGKALSHTGIGLHYSQNGNFNEALNHLFTALKLAGEESKTKVTAGVFANLGIVYMSKSDYGHSLQYTLKAMKLMEELGDRKGVAKTLGNSGSVYQARGENDKALENYSKALSISDELRDKNLSSILIGNIGIVYYNKKDYPKAESYFLKATQLTEQLGNKVGTARNLGNLANAYSMMNDQQRSIDCLFQSLKIQEELGMKGAMGRDLCNLGYTFLKLQDYKNAELYFKKAEQVLTSMGDHFLLSEVNDGLHNLYDSLARKVKRENVKIDGKSEAEFLRLSLTHYKSYKAEQDTVNSQEQKDILMRSEMNYEFEKKDAIAKAEYNEKSKRQNLLIWFIGAIALAITVIAVIVFRSLKTARRQKLEIEAQKKIVDEKNKNITDSINYAKKIQQSLLPTEKLIERLLNKK